MPSQHLDGVPYEMSEDTKETLSTSELAEEVRKIRQRMEEQSLRRHEANNQLQQTIGSFSTQALRQEDRLDSMETLVRKLAETVNSSAQDLRLIRMRLIGDDELKSNGLVQEVDSHKTKLSAQEKEIETVKEEIRFVRRMVVIVVAVIGTAGAIITFAKSTGFIHWISSP